MFRKKTPAARLSFAGILLALSWVTLFLAGFIPGMELTLFALSSFYVILVVGKTSIVNGWIFYAASCILSMINMPDKMGLLPYVLFFGLYPLIKYYAESLKKNVLEYVLKLSFFNGAFALMLFVLKSAFLGEIRVPDLPLPVIILGGQAVFLVYDRLLTLLYDYFNRRFHGSIEGRM